MEEKVKTRKAVKGNLPRKEADLNTVAAGVAASWEQNPGLTLVWTDVVQLKQASAAFGESYAERNDAKGARMDITHLLQSINAEIDKNVGYVKDYISEMYSKKEAPARYARFGIVKEWGKYKLPAENDKRRYALDQMLRGIAQDGLGSRKYGEAYWADVRERFIQAKSQAAETDKISTEHVSIKTEQRAFIKRTLNALVFLIKANYPDTWKEELRKWGFQKEKY